MGDQAFNTRVKAVSGDFRDGAFSWKLFSIIVLIHALAIRGILLGCSLTDILVLLVLHIFFCLSISIGYHRFLAHGAIVPSKWFGRVLTFLGNLNWEGGPLFWASAHRAHHQHTDEFGDPHTARRGFVWSHIGWMFYTEPNGFSLKRSSRYIPDLLKDPYLKFIEKHSLKINIAVIFVALALFKTAGRIDLFFWAVPIRIVTVWHATWAINSVMHGARFNPRKPPKGIRNLRLFNLISAGEGSHLNHHQRPVYRHGLPWPDMELVGPLLRGMKRIGLVRALRN